MDIGCTASFWTNLSGMIDFWEVLIEVERTAMGDPERASRRVPTFHPSFWESRKPVPEGDIPHLILYPLALRDILDHDDVTPGLFPRFPDRRYLEIHPDGRPVLRNVSFLQGVVVDLSGQEQRRLFFMRMKIIRMGNRLKGGGQQLLF